MVPVVPVAWGGTRIAPLYGVRTVASSFLFVLLAFCLAAPAADAGRGGARQKGSVGKGKYNSNRIKKAEKRERRATNRLEKLQDRGARSNGRAIKRARNKEERARKAADRAVQKDGPLPRVDPTTKGATKARAKGAKHVERLSQQLAATGSAMSARSIRLLTSRVAILSRRLQPGTKIRVVAGELRAVDIQGKKHVIARSADGRALFYSVAGQVMTRLNLPQDSRSQIIEAAR